MSRTTLKTDVCFKEAHSQEQMTLWSDVRNSYEKSS